MASIRIVILCGALGGSLLPGCRCQEEPSNRTAAPSSGASSASAPVVLYLPDAGAAAPPSGETQENARRACPEGMLSIAGAFCIDQYEAYLVDQREQRRVSPYYHPQRRATEHAFLQWQRQRLRVGSVNARQVQLPEPPWWQLHEEFEVVAQVAAGQIPNGYLSGTLAERACQNAGKRLCTQAEWVRACRGEADRPFPYGDEYRPGACNVYRASHAARVLHSDPSSGHLDPRLNLVEDEDGPLLRLTGSMPECRSEWPGGSLYDLVGNLDEWIADARGKFLGGFFSRGSRDGCGASISAHPKKYLDYSLGVRCCRDP